jgi:hypothetical protein
MNEEDLHGHRDDRMDVHLYTSVGPRTESDCVVLYGMLVEVEAPGRARTCCITCNEMRVTVSFPLSDTVRVGVKPTLTTGTRIKSKGGPLWTRLGLPPTIDYGNNL